MSGEDTDMIYLDFECQSPTGRQTVGVRYRDTVRMFDFDRQDDLESYINAIQDDTWTPDLAESVESPFGFDFSVFESRLLAHVTGSAGLSYDELSRRYSFIVEPVGEPPVQRMATPTAAVVDSLASTARASLSATDELNYQIMAYSALYWPSDYSHRPSGGRKWRWLQGRRYACGTYKGSKAAKRASRRPGNARKGVAYPAEYQGTDPALIGARALVQPYFYRSRKHYRVQVTPLDHRWSYGWHKSRARDWRIIHTHWDMDE